MSVRWMARATVVLALAAAGCGGTSPDDAVQVTEDWFAAVAEGDGARACELMLPTASRALSAKYLDGAGDPCPELVEAYRARLSDEKVDAIQDGGFEFSGRPEDDRLGVFPATERFQFEVVLMEVSGDEWRVASPGIGVDRPADG